MPVVKTKWIKITLTMPINELGNLLMPIKYEDNLGYGFDVIEISDSSIEVQYTEKNTYSEKIISPTGGEETISFDRYTIFNFSVYKFRQNVAFLKIESPPSSLKKFIGYLSNTTSKGVFIINNFLDIEGASKEIKNKWLVKNFKIKKIAIGNIKISKSSTSKMEISSEYDALEDFLKKFKEKNYKLNRIKISFSIDGMLGNIEMARTGMICIDEDVYCLIEGDLPDTIMSFFY